MRHIKPYSQLLESQTELTPEQIEWLDKCTRGRWKINTSTGLVDVDGNFDCSSQDLEDFKGVKFGKVESYFYCDSNQLTTLEGAPKKVGGGFVCNNNQLTTLKGSPRSVSWVFYCHGNQLTTLKGAPLTVGGDFLCDNNQLTSLEGAPRTVGGIFFCGNNRLTTLKGAPKNIRRYFYCANNQLTSLEGAPQTIVGNFYCENNRLTSLEGAPQSVGGGFYCSDNPVSETTLKSIFLLMLKGMGYQQALEKLWPKMDDEDKVLMYKQMPSLSPEDARTYKALGTYNKIKGYL